MDTAAAAPPQFFQVAATVIPLLLITIALTQAPMEMGDKALEWITRMAALAASVVGLTGALAALRFGYSPTRLGMTLGGLAVGFWFLCFGYGRKLVRDLDLTGKAESVARWLAFLVAVALFGVVLFVLVAP